MSHGYGVGRFISVLAERGNLYALGANALHINRLFLRWGTKPCHRGSILYTAWLYGKDAHRVRVGHTGKVRLHERTDGMPCNDRMCPFLLSLAMRLSSKRTGPLERLTKWKALNSAARIRAVVQDRSEGAVLQIYPRSPSSHAKASTVPMAFYEALGISKDKLLFLIAKLPTIREDEDVSPTDLAAEGQEDFLPQE